MMTDAQFYNKMMKKAYRVSQNLQDAEDAYQETAINMLKAKDVDNLEAYFSTSICRAAIKIRNKNNKYVLDNSAYSRYDDSEDSQDDRSLAERLMPQNETPVYRDYLMTNQLLIELAKLPKSQLEAIKYVLADNKFCEHTEGNYNTLKANYLHAIKKLQKHFNKTP